MILPLVGMAAAAPGKAIGFFVGDSDAYTCVQAVKGLDLPAVEIGVFTQEDVADPKMAAFVKRMDVAVVDIMPRQPGEWLLENIAVLKPGARVYAVRHSNHPRDYLDAGFISDKTVKRYFAFTSAANLKNLVLYLARRDLAQNTAADPPVIPPENGLYHPDAPRIFTAVADYVHWYRQSGHFQPGGLWDLSVIFPTFPVASKQAPVDALIRAYERQGINTITLLRAMKDWDQAIDRIISTEPLKSHLGSITGYTFKFSSRLAVNCATVLEKANVPVFNPQYLFFSSGKEWQAAEQGISPLGISMQFAVPELSGLIEPTVIGVKERVATDLKQVNSYRYVPVISQVEKLARRAARWHRLRQLKNQDKKIVLIYYNHGAGKQNIGASYLNVFRSIREIIQALRQEGYRIEGDLTEEQVMDLLLKSGRNIGTWAPDELDNLLRQGNAAFVDMADYRRWLAQTPPGFQEKVSEQWGRPEDANIMVKDGRFVIPCVRLGNLILAPQPVRGLSDDPDKLYHSTVLYPHHQYNAFYLWLQNVVKPDAMISLGTHGTHEWLPGKQAGLSHICPPEVLIGDIPSLYPYIVDDVGEGIQAKRRGRAAVIDHATPPFKKGGIYEEYSKVAALISEYESSAAEKIQAAKLERIRALTVKLGLDKDLDLQLVDDDALERIEHYLLALKTEMIPYGLHTFGISPAGEALEETAAAIAAKGGQTADFYQMQLLACGPAEMASLMRGLNGGYIPPAAGNDPIRNPESLPTGKDFYGFDPDKVPSKEAWAAGRKAAAELIADYRKRHDGRYPEQVGVILWSVETMRDEGINVATALSLLGMKPVWDEREKVRGVAPIPAAELKRPRIDVLLQMSGLFRDTFPTAALLLDQAVQQAATLTDLENFIAKHARQLEKSLIAEGYAAEEARKLSLVRLFSAKPGAYGTKVDDFTGASGLWEDDKVVAEGFIDMVSYGYSAEIWGKPLKEVYRGNLKKVDATLHSIGSNLYSTMDNDDMFQYLGGLSLAVRKESGKEPEVYVSQQKTLGQGHVEPLTTTIGRELRSRYLNPKWIAGMKQENYAGAREMAKFVEYMWGWQVTTPKAIDRARWEQTYEVYVEDKYGLEIEEFFNRASPWAYQSITARMLEAVRKGYWRASEAVQRKLAAEYAVSVVEKGVACCDHTCNNPLLNQMVMNIISLPGVVAPEVAAQFKLAIEKVAAKPLKEQVAARKELLKELAAVPAPGAAQAPAPDRQASGQKASGQKTSGQKASGQEASGQETAAPEKKSPTTARESDAVPKPQKPVDAAETVKGYKMEDIKTDDQDTQMSSSGVQWAAGLFILLLLGLFFFGSRRRRR
jgi:cobaltochelatase CobN